MDDIIESVSSGEFKKDNSQAKNSMSDDARMLYRIFKNLEEFYNSNRKQRESKLAFLLRLLNVNSKDFKSVRDSVADLKSIVMNYKTLIEVEQFNYLLNVLDQLQDYLKLRLEGSQLDINLNDLDSMNFKVFQSLRTLPIDFFTCVRPNDNINNSTCDESDFKIETFKVTDGIVSRIVPTKGLLEGDKVYFGSLGELNHLIELKGRSKRDKNILKVIRDIYNKEDIPDLLFSCLNVKNRPTEESSYEKEFIGERAIYNLI